MHFIKGDVGNEMLVNRYFFADISMFRYTWSKALTAIVSISLRMYVGNSISKLQIQVATYVFELSAGNCHR